MVRFNGIHNCLHRNDKCAGLIKLGQKLQIKLRIILNKKELIWFQRYRSKWLIDGDHNT